MASKLVRRPGESAFAVLLLVLAVTTFWQACEISGFTGLTTPGVFPMLASGTMVLAGLAILRSSLIKQPPDADDGPRLRRFLREIVPLRHAVLVGLVLAYLAIMPLLGFIVSSGLFLFAAFQFLWRKHPLVTAALTVVALATIYVIFREIFEVVLPRGTLLQGIL